MIHKQVRVLTFLVLAAAFAASLAVPAFAIDESEVEAAVRASSRETVTGNILVWFLCAVGFLKVSQKIDSFISSLGLNVGHTGGSMLAEAMIVARSATMAAGAAGKVVGRFGRGASGASGAGSAARTSGAAGSSVFFKNGLIGMTIRKVSGDAAKAAASTTDPVTPPSGGGPAASVIHTGKTPSADTAPAHAQAAAAEAFEDEGDPAVSPLSGDMGLVQSGLEENSGQDTPVSKGAVHRETDPHSAGYSAYHNRNTTQKNAITHTSIGGRIFTRSMLAGGHFASEVIGRVATGDIRSSGSITGDFAAQAFACYTGIIAQGNAAPQISYSDVEIGGGRITGTEYTPEHPEGISFGLYHTEQYVRPEGDIQKIVTADGAQWYKQYAVDTVVKPPYEAPDGEIGYHKKIEKRLPDPPRRKDRI